MRLLDTSEFLIRETSAHTAARLHIEAAIVHSSILVFGKTGDMAITFATYGRTSILVGISRAAEILDENYK